MVIIQWSIASLSLTRGDYVSFKVINVCGNGNHNAYRYQRTTVRRMGTFIQQRYIHCWLTANVGHQFSKVSCEVGSYRNPWSVRFQDHSKTITGLDWKPFQMYSHSEWMVKLGYWSSSLNELDVRGNTCHIQEQYVLLPKYIFQVSFGHSGYWGLQCFAHQCLLVVCQVYLFLYHIFHYTG